MSKKKLPEDIREDWMQMHHEELINDNKVFETVQLKLDIQMRKFFAFIIFTFYAVDQAYAGYGGWIDMLSNPKEHKYCGDLARSRSSNPLIQEEIYHACRSNIDLEKKLEKDFQDWKKKNK